MNLLNWLTAPRNERNCFKLVDRSLSLIPWDFVLIGEIPVRVNLKPSHSLHSMHSLEHICIFPPLAANWRRPIFS